MQYQILPINITITVWRSWELRGLRTSNYSSPEKGGRRFYFDRRVGITWFSGDAERGSVVTSRV